MFQKIVKRKNWIKGPR